MRASPPCLIEAGNSNDVNIDGRESFAVFEQFWWNLRLIFAFAASNSHTLLILPRYESPLVV